jgi:hypothetical protein
MTTHPKSLTPQKKPMASDDAARIRKAAAEHNHGQPRKESFDARADAAAQKNKLKNA